MTWAGTSDGVGQLGRGIDQERGGWGEGGCWRGRWLGRLVGDSGEGDAEAVGEDVGEEVEGLGVDGVIGGEDVGAVEGGGTTFHVGAAAAGFVDEEDAGGLVPGVEAEFPEGVKAPGGDVGEVEGGGASAADTVGEHGHLVEEVDIDVLVAACRGEAGGKEAFFEAGGAGDADRAVVEVSAGAAFGGKHLLAEGVEDDAGDEFAGVFQGEGDIEHGEAVGEVGGAVEGVDVPAEVGVGLMTTAFLGDDGVMGVVGAKAFDDELFGSPVSFGDEVEFAFEFEGDAAFEEIGEQGTSLAGDFGSSFQIGRHG